MSTSAPAEHSGAEGALDSGAEHLPPLTPEELARVEKFQSSITFSAQAWRPGITAEYGLLDYTHDGALRRFCLQHKREGGKNFLAATWEKPGGLFFEIIYNPKTGQLYGVTPSLEKVRDILANGLPKDPFGS